MWKIESLKLNNFRSFVDVEFKPQRGAYLIQGINNTDSGQKSNGSGKSSLREGLCFALGLPTFSDTMSDLINNNATSCTAYVRMRNDFLNQTLEVTRTAYLKKSAKLSISINEEDQKDKWSTLNDGNKFIFDTIGISKDDLLNHYIISQERFTSLFSSSDSKVKDLISRFSNFNKIDGVDEIVKHDLSVLESKVTELNSKRDNLQGRLDYLKEQLQKEKEVDLNEEKSRQISTINEKIYQYTEKIEECLKSIQEIEKTGIPAIHQTILINNTKIESLNTQLKDFGQPDKYDDSIKEIQESKKRIAEQKQEHNERYNSIQDEIKEYRIFKSEVETAIGGAIQCPKCMHEFLPSGDVDIKEAKKTLPTIIESIEKQQNKLASIEEEIKLHDSQILEMNNQLSKFQKIIDDFNEQKFKVKKEISEIENSNLTLNTKLNTKKTEIETLNSNIEQYKTSIENNKQAVKDIEDKEIESKEEEIKANIKSTDDSIVSINEDIETIKSEIFDKEQWIHRFKKFKSKLANESLDVIQGYTNMYLKNMDSDLNVKIEGFKQNKDGSIKEKITPIIMRNGEIEGSGNYKKYSAGERLRIDVAASILAIQSLINNSCATGGLDFLYIDEVVNSSDGLGLENMVDSIDKLNKYCLIVSHVTHEKVNNNLITIEKNNGVSEIIYN